jgi:hypothetical protein
MDRGFSAIAIKHEPSFRGCLTCHRPPLQPQLPIQVRVFIPNLDLGKELHHTSVVINSRVHTHPHFPSFPLISRKSAVNSPHPLRPPPLPSRPHSRDRPPAQQRPQQTSPTPSSRAAHRPIRRIRAQPVRRARPTSLTQSSNGARPWMRTPCLPNQPNARTAGRGRVVVGCACR